MQATRVAGGTETPMVAAQASGGSSYLLAIGFGTSVVMWGIGYLCRIPPALVPSSVLLLLLLATHFFGGFFAGRTTSAGWRAGLFSGGLAAVINLLVLGSLLTGENPNQLIPSALLWIPGSVLVGMILGAIGAVVGGRALASGTLAPPDVDWTNRFAWVGAAATLLLLIAGGLVTSKEAGLAVVDWPNSFGYNMFLFPLSRMTGGVYYEHAHRLLGALIGFTTLVLAIHLQFVDRRGWLRMLSFVALVVVIIQGLLGGLRVTGHFTNSASPLDTAPNLLLAVVHGVLAQVFFALMVAIAVFTSPRWKARGAVLRSASVMTDRSIAAWFVPLVVAQLVLGAVLRHFAGGLVLHISLATVVILLGLVAGLRFHGLYTESKLFQRLGLWLVSLIGIQLVLGLTALMVTSIAAEVDPPPAYEVIVTTAHQAVGALILGCGVLLALWSRRVLEPVESAT